MTASLHSRNTSPKEFQETLEGGRPSEGLHYSVCYRSVMALPLCYEAYIYIYIYIYLFLKKCIGNMGWAKITSFNRD